MLNTSFRQTNEIPKEQKAMFRSAEVNPTVNLGIIVVLTFLEENIPFNCVEIINAVNLFAH